MATRAEIIIAAQDLTAGPFAKVRAGMESLSGTAGKVSGALGAIAASGAVVYLQHLVEQATEAGATMANFSERMGISVASVSALKFAAEQSDTSFEALAGGIKKLSKFVGEAAEGNEANVKSFNNLGISIRNASGQIKSVDELLPELASVFAGMPDGIEKAALAMKFFGKNGEELIPFLNNGATGLKAFREEAERLGVVMDEKFARDAKNFEDNMKKMKSSSEAARYAIAGPLVESLGDASSIFIQARKESGSTAKAFLELAKQGAGLTALTPAAYLNPHIALSVSNPFGDRAKELKQSSAQTALAIEEAKKAEQSKSAVLAQSNKLLAALRLQDVANAETTFARAKRAYAAQVSEIEAAYKRRLEIEKKYTDLIANVSAAGSSKTPDGTLSQLNDAVSKAAAAANQAQGLTGAAAAQKAQEALRLADKAAALIESSKEQQDAQLKETGSRTLNEGDFATMAKKLKAIAEQAGATEQAAQQSVAAGLKTQVEQAVAAIGQAKVAAGFQFDGADARSQVEQIVSGLQDYMSTHPLVAGVQAQLSGANAPSFADTEFAKGLASSLSSAANSSQAVNSVLDGKVISGTPVNINMPGLPTLTAMADSTQAAALADWQRAALKFGGRS